jgi:hypothetical protein
MPAFAGMTNQSRSIDLSITLSPTLSREKYTQSIHIPSAGEGAERDPLKWLMTMKFLSRTTGIKTYNNRS